MLSFPKRFVERCFRRLGYEIRKLPGGKAVSDSSYGEVHPLADYSPWSSDESFRNIFSVIASHTLVDEYRCYELWQLVAEASKLPAGDLIEVGVWRGGTSGLIAARCAELGLMSQVYLCDTFKGVVKAGGKDGVYAGGEHADTSVPIVSKLMRDLRVSNTTILEGIFPEATSHLISQRSFRFCHIDVDVYQSAKDSVEWLWPRLLPGGIIVFDDYGFQGCEGVTRFVNEQRGYSDRTVVHNLNGHAVVIKRP